MAVTTKIVIDPKILESFEHWKGWVPAGYWANWLGVMTRAEVWAFAENIASIYSEGRFESPSFPSDDEQVLDWLPLLEAVLNSKDTFVMIALGSGWGRWLSGGAFAAKQKGRDYRLVGVEAEPEHFRWMQVHFQGNKLDPGNYRLINAAAAEHSGECWFYVGNSSSWYGQSIVPEDTLFFLGKRSKGIDIQKTRNNRIAQRTRCVDLKEVLGDLAWVDYMHMDIQGTEYEFLSADPSLLDARVRMINIGTHSVEIENHLRKFFHELGWVNCFDVRMNSKLPVYLDAEQISTVEFGDGVQIWNNTKLNCT